jgi:hypothetical protein
VRLVVELDAVDRGEGHASILGGGRGKRNREGGALAISCRKLVGVGRGAESVVADL